MKDSKYQENIIRIIRKLEKAEELSKKSNNEVRSHILFFSAVLYYKLKDYISAKRKLIECSKLNTSSKINADEFLNYIWNYKIKPPFWTWWLMSPLHTWTKRIIFLLVVFSIITLGLFHPLIYLININYLKINWSIYIIFLILLIAIVVFPNIKRIKTKELEIELNSPPADYEPQPISPSKIEGAIKDADKILEPSDISTIMQSK